MTEQVHEGDVFDVLATLPEKSVHTCVTSPPYFGLRDYQVEGQLGLEALHDCAGWATGKPCGVCYICRMVEVFRLVRRVLRDDGTAWVNMGDSYSMSTRGSSVVGTRTKHSGSWLDNRRFPIPPGLKPKDLCMIPARLALALQADGWYLRSDIIWHKPNPMPESVTDRPTKSHEYIFLLAKSERYYYDAAAVMESAAYDGRQDTMLKPSGKYVTRNYGQSSNSMVISGAERWPSRDGDGNRTRNRRSVWTVTTKPFSGAHFATFPPDLIEPCILAGAPEKCCPACGAPYERVVEKSLTAHDGKTASRYSGGTTANRLALLRQAARERGGEYVNQRTTIGFTPGCTCEAGKPVGGVVLDPFGGSGTTGLVARKHGRGFVLIEKNPEYATMIRARLNGTFEQLEAQKQGKPHMASLF